MNKLEETDEQRAAADTLLVGNLIANISNVLRDPKLFTDVMITELYNTLDSRLSAYRIAIALARLRESAARADVKEAETASESYQAQLADASDLADEQIKRCADLEQKLKVETEQHAATTARDLKTVRLLRERLRAAGLDDSIPET
jgi:small-conductance mechanosensitive channel